MKRVIPLKSNPTLSKEKCIFLINLNEEDVSQKFEQNVQGTTEHGCLQKQKSRLSLGPPILSQTMMT